MHEIRLAQLDYLPQNRAPYITGRIAQLMSRIDVSWPTPELQSLHARSRSIANDRIRQTEDSIGKGRVASDKLRDCRSYRSPHTNQAVRRFDKGLRIRQSEESAILTQRITNFGEQLDFLRRFRRLLGFFLFLLLELIHATNDHENREGNNHEVENVV